MVFLYVELWNVGPAWLALPQAEREEFVGRAERALAGLLASGIEVVGWGANEAATTARAPYDYFAVWKMPSAELMDRFERTIKDLGWRDYFEQVDLRGALTMPDAVIAEHVSLK